MRGPIGKSTFVLGVESPVGQHHSKSKLREYRYGRDTERKWLHKQPGPGLRRIFISEGTMVDIIRKFAQVDQDAEVGPREAVGIINDLTKDGDGDIVDPEGCDLADYQNNPIVLFNHLPDAIVARSKVTKLKNPSRLRAFITFPPEGISAKADEVCGLLKNGFLNGLSIGFTATNWSPIPGGGKHYTAWSLREFSIVSVPSNPNALVISRAANHRNTATKSRMQPNLRSPYPTDPRGGAIDWVVRTGLDAWLKQEWPGVTWNEAWAKEVTLVESLSRQAQTARFARKEAVKKRFADAAREKHIEEDFEKLQFGRLSFEEQQERRRQQVKALEPPRQPFRWDPYADGATNMHRLVQNQWNAGRRD